MHALFESPTKADNLRRHKSPNCSDANASVMFSYVGKSSGRDFASFMMSCQDETKAPDPQTLEHMKAVTADALEVHPDTVTIEDIDGVGLGKKASSSADELKFRRMASNCAAGGYRLLDVTSNNRFTCYYQGSGTTEKGERVINPYQKWQGTLPSCETGLELDDSTVQDVKKLAYSAAEGEKAGLDIDKFVCKIYSLPGNM